MEVGLQGEVTPRWQVFGRVLNLADTRHAETASFTQARGQEFAPGAPRAVSECGRFRGATP